MKKSTSKEYKITAHGSLGILALGHVGLRAWREVAKKDDKKARGSQKKKNED